MIGPEVVVVGAGPAGCATAIRLARSGRRVLLLERAGQPAAPGPSDPATPVWALTSEAVRLLRELGVDLPPVGDEQVVRGVTVHMRGRESLELRYPGDAVGRVSTRAELDHLLRTEAVRAGVGLEHDTEVTDLLVATVDRVMQVAGVVVRRGDGPPTDLPCRVVVAADGAASRLAERAGLRGPAAHAPSDVSGSSGGYAAHVVLTDLSHASEPHGLLELHLPLGDIDDRHVLPSCGWVYPPGAAHPSAVTVGVALFEDPDPASCHALLDRFLQRVRTPGSWAERAQIGPVAGGPIRMDVDPTRSSVPGLLLVGDAAGLASAFTAQGVSGALESAEIAASAVHDALDAPDDATAPDLGGYGRALGARFGGYVTSGRHAVRRYHLAWRVLQSTFDDDRPLFALTRRAVLAPDLARAETLLDPLPDGTPELTRQLRRELVDVGEVLATTVREQWPMFVRMAGVDRDLAGLYLRPSVLLLVTSHVRSLGADESSIPLAQEGGPSLATALAAAVDLGALAAIASDSTADQTAVGAGAAEPIPWGNRFAVLVADLLMARAYELSIRGGPTAVTLVAEALGTACEGRIHELRAAATGRASSAEAEQTIVTEQAAASFELPLHLGAMLAGCSEPATRALRLYGRRLGVAYAMLEELRRAAGQAPPWLPLRDDGRPRLDLDRLREVAVSQAEAAQAALRAVPDGDARDLLRALALATAASAGAVHARDQAVTESSCSQARQAGSSRRT